MQAALWCWILLFSMLLSMVESTTEMENNIERRRFLREVKGNLSGELWQEVEGFVGDPENEGSETWVQCVRDQRGDCEWRASVLGGGSAAFFLFTVATTIGYGQCFPKRTLKASCHRVHDCGHSHGSRNVCPHC